MVLSTLLGNETHLSPGLPNVAAIFITGINDPEVNCAGKLANKGKPLQLRALLSGHRKGRAQPNEPLCENSNLCSLSYREKAQPTNPVEADTKL